MHSEMNGFGYINKVTIIMLSQKGVMGEKILE